MIGVFLGAVFACGLGVVVVIAANDQKPPVPWPDLMINILINGVIAGFLAGVLRGPGKAGKWIEIPSDPPRRISAAMSFCPHLGAMIGGMLAGSVEVTTVMNADLASALARSPPETWATVSSQGVWDLVGRIVLGVILGSIAGSFAGSLLPSLNIIDEHLVNIPKEWETVPTSEEPQIASSRQTGLPVIDVNQIKVPPDSSDVDLISVLRAAEAACDAKDYEKVVSLLEAARSAFPDALAVASGLADAYAELGWHDKAEKEFRRAIEEIDPNDFVSHYNFGCFLRDIFDIEGAPREFQEAVALNPAYANAWINLSGLTNDPLEAIRCLQQARASGCQEEEMDAALAMWQELMHDQVDMDAQRLHWAEQALMKNDVKSARLHLALACRFNLDNRLRAVAYKIESDILRHQGDLAGSIERLRKAIELDPEPPPYWNTLSARENLLVGQQIDPQDVIGFRQQALEHALAAIQRGDYAMPHQNAAAACLALGRLKDAGEHAAKAKDMAGQTLAGNHICVGCPTEGKIEAECRKCLQKAEVTLRDIDLATGDYRAT